MVVKNGSWDTLMNEYAKKIEQGLKNWAKKGEQIKRNVCKQKQEWAEKKAYVILQRKRKLEKLKKLRKTQRMKVMKIRRRTWITFRVFVMTLGSNIVTWKHWGSNLRPTSMLIHLRSPTKKRSFQEIRKRKSCICATNTSIWNRLN